MEKRVLNELEPKIVWNIFEDITKVPHPSKKEEKIRKWIKNWAKKYNISVKEDGVGNILLKKEATEGCEDYPTLVLQAHMDMVCQKTPETEIDFKNDPLKIKIVDDYVTAEGTTLGADNGIGMAYGMAALISDIKHGPIEVVFTVDEETGLTGVFNMEKGFFSGKYLLNLDSETLGEITIGSAGGGDTHYILPVDHEEKKNWRGIRLSIKGLKGGHSGIDIHLPRLNAIKVVIEGVLYLKNKMDTLISSINGGSVHNAIPRECVCDFLVLKEKIDEAVKILEDWKMRIIEKNKKNEPEMKIVISEISKTEAIIREQSDSILNLLNEVPHGPLSFSKEMEGLVQTSNNLAVVKSGEDKIEIFLSSRSQVDRELEELRKKLKILGEKYNADVIQEKAYPGWQADLSSPFLALVKNSYEDILKNEVSVKIIHGGLECGLFSKFDQELQIASIGPEIKDVHTPNEKIYIKSVGTVWDVIRKIIENIGHLDNSL